MSKGSTYKRRLLPRLLLPERLPDCLHPLSYTCDKGRRERRQAGSQGHFSRGKPLTEHVIFISRGLFCVQAECALPKRSKAKWGFKPVCLAAGKKNNSLVFVPVQWVSSAALFTLEAARQGGGTLMRCSGAHTP